MAPNPPAPLRQSSSKSSFGHVEQAGRSPTGLHAQASSASLNSSVAGSSRSKRLQPQRPVSESSGESTSDAVLPATSQTTEPLQPTSSGDTASSTRTSKDATRPIGGAARAAALAGSSGLPAPPRIPAARENLSSRGSWSSLARAGTPRSVNDLGTDYSRYYNPFSSKNNSSTDLLGSPMNVSQVNLNVPLLGAQEKRHSNPFDDGKRVSSDNKEENKDAKAAAAAGVLMAGVPTAGAYMNNEKSFFPYLDDRLGAPGADQAGYTFPMMWDEKEDDDDMHMPMVDDDIRLKPRWKDRLSRDNIFSTIGMVFMAVGLLMLFIVLPVLSSTGLSMIDYAYDTPLDQFSRYAKPEPWATVNDRKYPLMSNMRSTLIDPDTPDSAKTKVSSVDGETLNLVFSDEFNTPNRSFYRGDDPYFFGADFWYAATKDLEWYDPDAITTWNGALELRIDKFRNHNLDYRSGMLNSWNQMCFKGGILEVSVSLPGPAGVHGLWPGVWSMGNLGRPGYLATTYGTWPYTYDDCDSGITPNQSMTDGTSKLPGQRLPSCVCKGEDHPSPGTGRGAVEIDVLEGAADWGFKGWSTATQSMQVAPFDIWYYPDYQFFETPRYENSFVNSYTGGPFQQAVSVTTMLNNDWFDGNAYQRYSYDYEPGTDENAYVAFLVGDDIQGKFDGRALGPNGNVKSRPIAQEPMSLIFNLGISPSWTNIDFPNLRFPSVMRIDYVRIYQRDGKESVTCDPPGYPTTKYIAEHPEAYNNPNYTQWTEIPGYTWPKNTLMHGCDA
ncbi:hypothetical protein KVT40_005515 [Elsinoe batatas]|uniref:GH16 domain-containing protein n=1 Tax=Elsinoe batatas TaxID=2601811 RepID=A0A8K0L0C0_9PEZI|nr:hypothetical protein KVT40_005515 [Elsinoe batatas]